MLIRSRREFLKDTLRSVTALGRGGQHGKIRRDERAGRHRLGISGAGVHLPAGRQRRAQYRDPHHHGAAELQPVSQGAAAWRSRKGLLLPIANGSDTYGLHPSLVEIQGLYNQGKAAVLANVGMLVQPITRAIYLTNNSALIPSALFSHSDQSSQWQTGIPSGTGSSGWGGRITDLLQVAELRRDLSARDGNQQLPVVLHRGRRPFRPRFRPPAWPR